MPCSCPLPSSYLAHLPSEDKAKFAAANSVWLKKSPLAFRKEFLQTNADYFGADIFSSEFDEKTLSDINQWVSDCTNGMIPEILDEIPPLTVMYLINALSFDAEWQTIYREEQIYESAFINSDGKTERVSMMCAEESCYLHDGKATGFAKPYVSGYSFVAMLPDEGVTLEEYIPSMSLTDIAQQIRSDEKEPVMAAIPKFNTAYAAELSNILKQAGMTDAFDPDNADFTEMADVKPGDLYINRVLHKTAINVDERGTKAGAVTAVEICCW